MMNPNGGLAALVAALEGGMEPDQGFGIMQYLEQEQQNRVAQRAERLGGLASLLTNAAGSGMDYQGAEALLDAQPGPMGPAVQNMLAGAYPTAQPGEFAYQPEMSTEFPNEVASGQVPSPAAYEAQRMATQSPMYNPSSPEMMAQQQGLQLGQLQIQQAQGEMQSAQEEEYNTTWGVFAQSMMDAQAQGQDSTTAYRTFILTNPQARQILNGEPGRVQAVLQQVFQQ